MKRQKVKDADEPEIQINDEPTEKFYTHTHFLNPPPPVTGTHRILISNADPRLESYSENDQKALTHKNCLDSSQPKSPVACPCSWQTCFVDLQ